MHDTPREIVQDAGSLESLEVRLPQLPLPGLQADRARGAQPPPTDRRLLHDILQWDVRAWSRAIDFWDRAVDWSRVQQCLELGGRQGGLSLWLAKKDKQVVCSDLKGVQHLASDCHSRHNLHGLVSYQDIDATCIPYTNHFDLVAFKSMLGAVGHVQGLRGQQIALEQMWKALKPGGQLVFAENLRASAAHQLARRKYVRWASAWRYVSIGEMQRFLEPFHDFQLRVTGVLGTFGRSELQRNVLAAIDQHLVDHITPGRWKYIVYGVATK